MKKKIKSNELLDAWSGYIMGAVMFVFNLILLAFFSLIWYEADRNAFVAVLWAGSVFNILIWAAIYLKSCEKI